MSHATDQSSTAPSHASVFIWVFAISAIWHYTSSSSDIVDYWLRFDPLVTPLVFVSIVTAFVAAVFPNKTLALLIFAGGEESNMSSVIPSWGPKVGSTAVTKLIKK